MFTISEHFQTLDQSQYLAWQGLDTGQTIVFSWISTMIFRVFIEWPLAFSSMKATEKHFILLRKIRVITKVSQNTAWIWHFFTKKVKIGNFLRKSMSLDAETVLYPGNTSFSPFYHCFGCHNGPQFKYFLVGKIKGRIQFLPAMNMSIVCSLI